MSNLSKFLEGIELVVAIPFHDNVPVTYAHINVGTGKGTIELATTPYLKPVKGDIAIYDRYNHKWFLSPDTPELRAIIEKQTEEVGKSEKESPTGFQFTHKLEKVLKAHPPIEGWPLIECDATFTFISEW